MSDVLRIADREFHSRLFVGTGKYRSFQEMARCHEASGAEVVTVAVRRVNLTDRSKESLLDYIDRSKMFILPNTAGCYTADEAIRTARLGREVGLSNWVKLEVIGDEKTLFPDNAGLIEATRVLVKEGFVVLPYTNDDLVNARKLIDAGAAAVMPLAAPIGIGPGHSEPDQSADSARDDHRGAADRGRRRGHRLGRRDRHGTGLRRRADEHRHRRGGGLREDGDRDEAGGRGRPLGVSGGAHAEEAVRQRKQSAGRRRALISHRSTPMNTGLALYFHPVSKTGACLTAGLYPTPGSLLVQPPLAPHERGNFQVVNGHLLGGLWLRFGFRWRRLTEKRRTGG